MEFYQNQLDQFNKLPIVARIAVFASLGFLVANILIFVSITAGASWKIDSGLATLTGSIVGLCVLAWQTGKGFKNIIRSQENQAKLERDARIHQHELNQSTFENNNTRERNVLVAALWAEVYSLHSQVSDAQTSARMMKTVYEQMKKQNLVSSVKEISFPVFDAPIFKANISKLGMLGASIAADVVLVASRAKGGDPIKIKSETQYSHDILATIYTGNEQVMTDWRQDLLHVANRLRSVRDGSPDPGPLVEDRQRRKSLEKPEPAKT